MKQLVIFSFIVSILFYSCNSKNEQVEHKIKKEFLRELGENRFNNLFGYIPKEYNSKFNIKKDSLFNLFFVEYEHGGNYLFQVYYSIDGNLYSMLDDKPFDFASRVSLQVVNKKIQDSNLSNEKAVYLYAMVLSANIDTSMFSVLTDIEDYYSVVDNYEVNTNNAFLKNNIISFDSVCYQIEKVQELNINKSIFVNIWFYNHGLYECEFIFDRLVIQDVRCEFKGYFGNEYIQI
jgi:hypothetical protein